MSLSIKLSTKNFAEASKITGNDEFYFIIGDSKLSCHKFVAAFLSRHISKILVSDPTVDSIHICINTKNSDELRQKEAQIKTNLQHLIFGEIINISEEEIQQFATELESIDKNSQISDLSSTNISSLLILNQTLQNDEINDEIYRRLFSFLISDNKSNENNGQKELKKEEIEQKIQHIQKVDTFIKLIEKGKGTDNNVNFIEYANKYLEQEYNHLIDQIASQLDEIDEKYIFEMNEILLNAILSSPNLQVQNEDALLAVLLNRRAHLLSKENGDFEQPNFFLEKVEFEYLSEEGIKQFLDEIELDEISVDVWSQLKKRLSLPVHLKHGAGKRHRKQQTTNIQPTFRYDSSNPFNGILRHLTKTTGGNIQTNKTIEIKASNLCCGQLETLVDFDHPENGYTHINNNPTPRWLQIDFKTTKVQIDSYLIKSPKEGDSSGARKLRSWKIEISSDGSSWEAVDERTDVSELKGNHSMQLFNLNKITEPFRFIRIITDKNNWHDNDGFNICKLELFGNIIGSS